LIVLFSPIVSAAMMSHFATAMPNEQRNKMFNWTKTKQRLSRRVTGHKKKSLLQMATQEN
jgi:hypothetical protein